MRGRLYTTATLTIVVLLGGCVQATRHSNTMVFGTNTSLGVKVGVSATSVPEATIGYARQEAVVMPLVANTEDNGTYQEPCDISKPLTGGTPYVNHPCALVATRGGSQDSYSVLASFGAQVRAAGKPDGTEAGVGLAQYFATGMAAQLLAVQGGAAVVAIGPAATASAKKTAPPGVIESMMATPEEVKTAIDTRNKYRIAIATVAAGMRDAPDMITLRQQIAVFETMVKPTRSLICSTTVECAELASSEDWHVLEYRRNPKVFNDAVAAVWP